MNRLPIAAALLLVLSGCAGTTFNSGLPILVKPQDAAIIGKSEGLPDIARGNQARLAGRFDDAERNLKPLAERGYPDAQVYLAATYSQMDRVDKNRDAIVWYRAALPTRPEIDISLARALINSGDRVAAIEAKGLILRARDERNDPSANSTLLFLYMTRPDFDVNKDAPALADKLSRSPLPADRIAAITWYREYIADDDHAERLFDLCKANLDIHLNCFIDLAHFYRYRNERPELDALVDYSLKVFAKGTPPPDPAVLYAVPEPVERLAGRLAAAMVEHVELADEVEFFETFKSQSQNDDGVDNDDAGVDESADLPEVQISPTPPPPDESASKASSAAIIEKADLILRWMLKQPGDFPVNAAIFAVPYPFLLPDVDIGGLLKQGVANGNHAAQFALGDYYLAGQRTVLNPQEAEKNYQVCLQFGSTLLGANYRLGRLYVRSELGNPQPMKALHYYLEAARRGNGRAYYSLAYMFTAAYGIRVDRINAYAFARRAEDSGRPLILRLRVVQRDPPTPSMEGAKEIMPGAVVKAYKLLDRLRAEFTPDELARAEALYEAERKAFPVVQRPVRPDVYAGASKP